MVQSPTASSTLLCWCLFNHNVSAGLCKSTPQPYEKKVWFIYSAGKMKSNITSVLSIMGSSYQAEQLEAVHSWQLGPDEMQLFPSSKHITQNAPITHIMNWEHMQSQDRTDARLQLWTELRCQPSEIHNLKLQSLFSKRETDSNVRFMTCLDFFPFHHITVTVYRMCRAVCVGCTWPVRIKYM